MSTSPVWAPHQIAFINTVERLQQKYTRFTFWLTRTPYSSYINRVNHLNMLTLESRRVYFDACLLHDIMHNEYLIELANNLEFRTVDRPNRNHNLFRSKPANTSYGLHTNPIRRLQSAYNSLLYIDHIDI